MSFNLQSYGRISSLIDGEPLEGGSIDTPVSIVINGQTYNRVFSIANGANSLVYNNDLSGFEYLFIQSDFNTRALVTDNSGNSLSLGIRGTAKTNQYGIPFQLGLDETANSTVLINAIRIFNTSGSTAKVKIIAVK